MSRKICCFRRYCRAARVEPGHVGSAIATQWFGSDGVEAVVDVPNSSVALAVQEVARTKNKVLLISGAAASDLTGEACSPTSVHWTYDTLALANGTGAAVANAARGPSALWTR